MRPRVLPAALLIVLPALAGGQQWDSSAMQNVAPGVVHRRLVANSGPWRVNVLEVNLRQPGLALRAVRANDAFLTRERLSSMTARYPGPGKAIAGINTDFFNVRTGESENNVVIEGEILKGLRVTDSPHDSFDNAHTQFAIDWSNRPYIGRFSLDAILLTRRGSQMQLGAINHAPDSVSVVLYTGVIGDSTPVDSTGRSRAFLRLRPRDRRGDTLTFDVDGGVVEAGRLALSGGAALASFRRAALDSIACARCQIRVVARIGQVPAGIRMSAGGWPRLVEQGVNIAGKADSLEGTFPRFSAQRHPRAAVGFSRDSTTLYLVTVDGRRPTDAGMTLVELAQLMLDLGATEAMNFDGGGSTTMVVDGRVVNLPSDQAGERPIGSGLLVIIGGT